MSHMTTISGTPATIPPNTYMDLSSTSATHRIFNIPEIVGNIVRNLNRRELVHLVTVSRQFFRCTTPLLWENLANLDFKALCNLVLPDFDWKTVHPRDFKRSLLHDAELLDVDHLSRFNIYAPYVKRLEHPNIRSGPYPDWGQFLGLLIKVVPTRPLLPNLRALWIRGNLDPLLTYATINAIIGPALRQVSFRGPVEGHLHPAFSSHIVSRIVDECANIETLDFNTKLSFSNRHTLSNDTNLPKVKIFDSLGLGALRLHGLRTLGAGPEILAPEVLSLLATLPSLQSLIVRVLWNIPGFATPRDFSSVPSDGFPALQHFTFVTGGRPHFPSLHLWKTLPFMNRIISLHLDLHPPISENKPELVLTILQSCPNITDLHLDITLEFGDHQRPNLLPPSVVERMSQLPLQRIQFLPSFSSQVHNAERLLQALPNVEYLDLNQFYFSVQDLVLVANLMPKLQFLAVRIDLSGNDKVVVSSASPSRLYLELCFTRNRKYWFDGLKEGEVDSIARILHGLWPSGVYCAESACVDDSSDTNMTAIRRLNQSLEQLGSPGGSLKQSMQMYNYFQWKFDFGNYYN